MRQSFKLCRTFAKTLKDCKNIKLQKSHFYSKHQILWNSQLDFSKIALIFDHFYLLVGWYNLFLQVFMILTHPKPQNKYLKTANHQKNQQIFRGHFSMIEFYHWYTQFICSKMSSTNCLNPGELKYGVRLDDIFWNLSVVSVQKATVKY